MSCHRFKHCSGRPRDRALTLVEVLGGLALLGSVLAAMLVAHGRLTRQHGQAIEHRRAVAATDRMLKRWWQDLEKLPRRGSGRLEGTDQLHWRTRVMRPTAKLERLRAERLELTVFSKARSGREEVLRLELLLPEPGEDGEAKQDEDSRDGTNQQP